MQGIATLSEFLLQAKTEYLVFDMGRTIRPLSAQQFLELETAQFPTPYARLQHGWFGILFHNKQLSTQHYIWFVKLPLDEQGLIIAAARDEFIQHVINALGQQLQRAEQNNGQIPDNPYCFVPAQQQLSDFNAISRHALKRPASEHLPPAQAYLCEPQHHDWQTLALQGISDFVVYANHKQHQQALSHLSAFPESVLRPLLSSYEHYPLNQQMTRRVIDWAKQQDNNRHLALALRAIANSSAQQSVTNWIADLLARPQNLDVLVVIGGRHWRILQHQPILISYLEQLAQLDQQQPVFSAMFADLVQLPDIRTHLLSVLRMDNKSALLTRAIGALFSEENHDL